MRADSAKKMHQKSREACDQDQDFTVGRWIVEKRLHQQDRCLLTTFVPGLYWDK